MKALGLKKNYGEFKLRILAILIMLLFSLPADANQEKIEVDISSCFDRDAACFSKGQHTFYAEEKVKVLAWFDIVYLGDEKQPNFYPLFNVYNHSMEPITIEIGMQLLDENDTVLIEIKYEKTFEPTEKTEPSYETYISLNAEPLTEDIIKDTKYVRVVYNRDPQG